MRVAPTNRPTMHRSLITCLLSLLSLLACSQNPIVRTTPTEGIITLAEGVEIPKVPEGYVLWMPENARPEGMLVFIHHRPEHDRNDLIALALSQNLAVIHAITENRLEWFFDPARMQQIENYLYEAITEYNIPADRLYYCGMSLGGTRALKLAIYGQSKASKHRLTPRAVVMCDSPLDMVRFHRECSKAASVNFSEAGAAEGAWVSECLRTNLGGTPSEAREAYINYAPYCYSAEGGPYLQALSGIAIRAYTEPDIHWWIEHRRKDYYSMNSLDMAALVNDLKILGHVEAELITTENKGYTNTGERHPHTWNIVDEVGMIAWLKALR